MTPRAVVERVVGDSGKPERFRPGAVQLSSENRWTGIRLERRVDDPGEIPEGYWPRHIVLVYRVPPVHRERYEPGRGWQTVALKRWSVEILPACVSYASRWGERADALLLEIAPELLTLVAGTSAQFRSYVNAQDAFIVHSALALERDVCEGSPAGALYGETVATALAAHLVRWHSRAKPQIIAIEPRGAQLDRVMEFINDNLDTNLSLHRLAELAQMDLYRFIRAFKQATGLPPHQYVLRQRIERAKSLLKDSVLPVTEIALRSGFADQSHFTTAFRRITSLRPGEYRSASK